MIHYADAKTIREARELRAAYLRGLFAALLRVLRLRRGPRAATQV